MRRFLRTANWVLAVLVLLATGVVGLRDGLSDVGAGETVLQNSVSGAVLIYGIFGIIAGVGVLACRRWGVFAVYPWAAGAVYAATVASFAFSDPTFSKQGTIAGVVGAFVASVLMGWWAIWAAGTRVGDASLPPIPGAGDIPPR